MHARICCQMQNQMEKSRFQIAVSLSEDVIKIISREYSVDVTKAIPHISIYGAEFPFKDYSKITDIVGKIAKKISKFNIKVFTLKSDNGYLLWPVKDSNGELEKLHLEIIEKINPLRNGLLRDKFLKSDYLNSLPSQQRNLV